MGYEVRASKVTGTAGLKDILNMQDVGADRCSDFSFLGFPSTYMLDEAELVDIFEKLDARYAADPKRYWVVEFADGVLQRETSMLLKNSYIRSRIHRLVLSATDSFGALGALNTLRQEFDLMPHAISGICSSSPLMVRELSAPTKIPVANNVRRDLERLSEILI